MERTPLIMVDVDGVLNAAPWGGEVPEGHTVILGGRVHLNPAHGPKLLALAEQTGAELVWCTWWEGAANRLVAPRVGLPQLPVVPIIKAARGVHGVGAAKAASAARYAGKRPYVWFDDEPDAGSWTQRFARSAAHVVAVDAAHGLTDADIAEARAWLLARTLTEREVALAG